jgi:hypothetical protein
MKGLDPSWFDSERERRKFWRFVVSSGWVEPSIWVCGKVHQEDAREMMRASIDSGRGSLSFRDRESGAISGFFRGYWKAGFRAGVYAQKFHPTKDLSNAYGKFRRIVFEQYCAEAQRQKRIRDEAKWQEIRRLSVVLHREQKRLERLKRHLRRIKGQPEPKYNTKKWPYADRGIDDAETFRNYYNALCDVIVNQIFILSLILNNKVKP